MPPDLFGQAVQFGIDIAPLSTRCDGRWRRATSLSVVFFMRFVMFVFFMFLRLFLVGRFLFRFIAHFLIEHSIDFHVVSHVQSETKRNVDSTG